MLLKKIKFQASMIGTLLKWTESYFAERSWRHKGEGLPRGRDYGVGFRRDQCWHLRFSFSPDMYCREGLDLTVAIYMPNINMISGIKEDSYLSRNLHKMRKWWDMWLRTLLLNNWNEDTSDYRSKPVDQSDACCQNQPRRGILDLIPGLSPHQRYHMRRTVRELHNVY